MDHLDAAYVGGRWFLPGLAPSASQESPTWDRVTDQAPRRFAPALPAASARTSNGWQPVTRMAPN